MARAAGGPKGRGKRAAEDETAAGANPPATAPVGGGSEIAALASASLEELQRRYPAEWQRTGQDMVAAFETGQAAGAARFLAKVRAEAAPWRARVQQSGKNPRVVAAALPVLVRERMARLAVKAVVEGTAAVRASGDKEKLAQARSADEPGRVLRFGRFSGTLVNALFFRRGLERKPVAWPLFRLLWPLVTEKALLMPLVEPKGIYCFYSQPLIAGLAKLKSEVGGEALEVAAGDGTLARFLTAAGTPVRATDDQSWSHSIEFPADVERMDAAAALNRYQPSVVLCSWPPPGNSFERQVFRQPQVKRYIVLTTRHRFAAGAWPAYDEAAERFERRVAEDLSRFVLPPEINPVVLVFDRRP